MLYKNDCWLKEFESEREADRRQTEAERERERERTPDLCDTCLSYAYVRDCLFPEPVHYLSDGRKICEGISRGHVFICD